MIIDVDLGNTRLKWRYSDRAEALRFWSAVDSVPDEWLRLPAGFRMRISSVIGEQKTAEFVAAVNKCMDAKIEIAKVTDLFAGVSLAYKDASFLGVDRWLALLAAHDHFPGRDCLILHCGTAAVADLLTADGKHVGGYIVPGLRTSLSALGTAAHGLSAIHFATPAQHSRPGATTLECIEAGQTLLYSGFLRELIQISTNYLVDPQWVFAGGDGDWFREAWYWIAQKELMDLPESKLVSELVLDGLAIALP